MFGFLTSCIINRKTKSALTVVTFFLYHSYYACALFPVRINLEVWILYTVGGIPRRGNQLRRRCIHGTTQTEETRTDIPASSGIRTHELSVWAGEDSSCLSLRGHCDPRLSQNKKTNSVAWVRKRTIPSGRLPLVGEVSANFSGQIPTAVNLGFLDRYFLEIAPWLSSVGWVDPVPDPLLLRKSGSAGNRTRELWICSQELWPLDLRGSLAFIYHFSC
jgi:hypothetical protein